MNEEKKYINAIRYLSIKTIHSQGGGHIGMAMSSAPILYTLFTKFLRLNPKNGKWINRDRFVLSAGHGSVSLYSTLHLSGILPLEELKNFRKENSKTPGHPEFENKNDNFIDASTGPLGQGFAMGVGMAIAEKHLSKINHEIPSGFNHDTYILVGDGDLQEGISYESMALAGKMNLNKIIVLHDSNKFQLDTSVEKVSIEDLKLRCESNNWYYQKTSNDPSEIANAIKNAKKSSKPSFIEVETIIAESLPIQNTNKGHHAIITNDDLKSFNSYFGTNFKKWNIDKDIYDHFKINFYERCEKEYEKWIKNCSKEKINNPLGYSKFEKIIYNNQNMMSSFSLNKIQRGNAATRDYLKWLISDLSNDYDNVLSICADVKSSTNISVSEKDFNDGGNDIYAGIREFAMGAISNGISLHGGIKVISGTFLAFADYMKPAIRLSAMMKIPNIFVFTHDSIAVGEDGPTHQPYDQIPMLRAIENVYVHRPSNELEVRQSLIESFDSIDKTHVIILSRQAINSFSNTSEFSNIQRGAYPIINVQNPDIVIAASGSEVALAKKIADIIPKVKVVSVPCLDKLDFMNKREKALLFKASKALITLEASSDYKWLTLNLQKQKNFHMGVFKFGKSMPGEDLYKSSGFDVGKLVNFINENILKK